jgi:proline dehydrogenase
MVRAALLGAASHRGFQRFVTKHGGRFGAYRFVAGETLDQLMRVIRELNARGIRVSAGLLGENVVSREDAVAAAGEYVGILERFARDTAQASVAPWPTQLGLSIDGDLAFANMRAVAERAAACGSFVRVVMEGSAYTDGTLALYRRLRDSGLDVGTVLQAYLYRSEADLRSLLPLQPNLRIVKGAYLEPASIAFPKKRDVDANYVRLMELSLRESGFTAIATHDEAIIRHAIEYVRHHAIPSARFEFQMLYGVASRLASELVERGFAMRVAVPFGSQWYPYFMRRLGERPANVLFLLSSVWRA